MFRDEFKERYTTIPFAVSRTYSNGTPAEVITHQHREIELISVDFGEADFYVNSKLCRLAAGDVLIIPPYALHRAVTSKTEATSYSCICFDTELLCDNALKSAIKEENFGIGGRFSSEFAFSAKMREYIGSAVRACEEKWLGWELEAVGFMSLLFGIVKKNAKPEKSVAGIKDAEFGKCTMTYIIENYQSDATSRTASEALHMNHSYFCRLFKKTFGTCFANYILAYRLERAQIYLRCSSLSVTEIAFKVGFNNCSYFGKAFKERFGISPLSYRKTKT